MYSSPPILYACIWHTKAQKLWKMNNLKQQTMEWISVKDRLPYNDGTFLVYSEYHYYCQMSVGSFDSYLKVFYPDKVTHWMPLPNPPSNE